MSNFLKLDFNERSDQLSGIAKRSEFSDLWRYPERQSLEQKLAAMNGLEPSQVLCTNGGDEAIMILMRIIKETSSLILPQPAFSQYTWGNQSWKLNSQLISANPDLTIDLDATLAAVKQTPGAITVITRPNNPTGESIEWNKLVEVIQASQKVGGWVFLDEAYIEFSNEQQSSQGQPKTNQLISQFENLVILRTLSKAYGLAGIRLGYIIGNQALIEAFSQRCMPFNVPQPSLQIAATALSDNNVLDMNGYCQRIKKNRSILQAWLIQNRIESVESDANFILFRVSTVQAQAIQSFLAKNEIAVRTFSRGDLSGCVRVTIPYELDRLMPLLEQVLTPKLICLDMDGVLIDTSSSYDETIKATVKFFSDIDVQQQEIFQLKDSGGFNNDWLLTQQLLKQNGFDVSLEAVTDKFQALYLGKDNNGFVANEELLVNPKLVATINATRSQVAIVTGRPRNEANAGIKLVAFTDVDLVSLDDVEQPKPSPEGVQKLQSKYSNSSWMCGDNPDDMKAANGSNSLAIGIGKRNAETLYQAGADIVLESINQLEDWLNPVTKND